MYETPHYREVFLSAGWLCPWRDDELSQDEVDRLQFVSELGVPILRTVVALYGLEFSPLRIDQYDHLMAVLKLFPISDENVAACFGYLDGKHVLEGPVTDPPTRLYPKTLRAITLWRIVVGDKAVPINAKMSFTTKRAFLAGVLT